MFDCNCFAWTKCLINWVSGRKIWVFSFCYNSLILCNYNNFRWGLVSLHFILNAIYVTQGEVLMPTLFTLHLKDCDSNFEIIFLIIRLNFMRKWFLLNCWSLLLQFSSAILGWIIVLLREFCCHNENEICFIIRNVKSLHA